MNSRITRFPIPVIAMALTAVFSMGCDEHAPLRDNAVSQNNVLTQSKMDELKPAEGVYKGRMVMTSHNSRNRSHACTLTVQRVIENVADNTTPTETVGKPKITATLLCDDLANAEDLPAAQREAALAKFKDLTDAMGTYTSVIVDQGNYNKTTKIMTLPYQVVGFTTGTNFGDISGKLDIATGHFRGTWYARALGETVATFDFVKQ